MEVPGSEYIEKWYVAEHKYRFFQWKTHSLGVWGNFEGSCGRSESKGSRRSSQLWELTTVKVNKGTIYI
jgi:1,4-alpha-glucan branching enzyme